jgi:hypothetical protein
MQVLAVLVVAVEEMNLHRLNLVGLAILQALRHRKEIMAGLAVLEIMLVGVVVVRLLPEVMELETAAMVEQGQLLQ